MADVEKDKKEDEGAEAEEAEATESSTPDDDAPVRAGGKATSVKDEKAEASDDDEAPADVPAPEGDAAPVAGLTLGSKRFVYAAYFGGGIAVAFVVSKAASTVWHRLSTWKPQLGEPREEYVMPAAAVIGLAVALYYWRRDKTREYVEQVAEELSKVTWPSRKEVTNSTFVVIVTTAFATVFFALMDQFWRYVTNLVYGF